MWITRCVPVCRAALASHPVLVGVPAAVTTLGAGLALAQLLAPPVAKPQLPCGCHQVWIAPTVPMTPATYRKVMNMAGEAALAAIPPDNTAGDVVDTTLNDAAAPSSLQPLPRLPLDRLPTPRRLSRTVPEPASIAVLATGLLGILLARRRV